MLQGELFDQAIGDFALAAKDAGIPYAEFKYIFADGDARASVRASLMDQGIVQRVPKWTGAFLVEWAE